MDAVCVKVAELRAEGYSNLEDWLAGEKNLYAARFQGIYRFARCKSFGAWLRSAGGAGSSSTSLGSGGSSTSKPASGRTPSQWAREAMSRPARSSRRRS